MHINTCCFFISVHVHRFILSSGVLGSELLGRISSSAQKSGGVKEK